MRFDKGDESDDLEESENSKGGHVLRGEEGEETDKGNLHRGEGSDGVKGGVGDVESGGVSSHEKEHEDVEREHVGDERISTW